MSQIQRILFPPTLVFALSMVACSDTPGVVGGEPTLPDPPKRELVVETLVERVRTIAGESFGVTCVVSEDREQVTDVATQVTVDGEVIAETSDGIASLTLVTRGTYLIACEGITEDVTDEIGVVVEVLPAAPVLVETALDAEELPAGAPVLISCSSQDAYGNTIESLAELPPGLTLSWQGDASILRESQDELSFRGRGTTAGDYTIGCSIGDDIVDETPSPFSVVAGAPAYSETTVTPSTVRATESATVGCVVYDAYGNARVDVAASFWAQSLDGTRPLESGLWFDEETVSAAVADDYWIFCRVPGQVAGDESPAKLSVLPGGAYTWSVTLPELDCYAQGIPLPIEVMAWDRFGNTVEEPGWSVSVFPDNNASVSDEGVSFESEGDFQVWVEWTDESDPLASLETEIFEFRVDSTAPQFVFSTPLIGLEHTYLEEGAEQMSYEFAVSDALSDIRQVTFRGKVLASYSDQTELSFTEVSDVQWGMNSLFGSATDECGNRTSLARSFLASDEYAPAAFEPDSSAAADDGVVLRINQMLLDDENRLDLDDIATAAEVAIESFSFRDALPTVLVSSPADLSDPPTLPFTSYDCDGVVTIRESTGYWVRRDGLLRYDPVKVNSLQIGEQGLSLSVSVRNLGIDLSARGALDLGCSGQIAESVSGSLDIDLITLSATVGLEYVNGIASTSICETCLDVDIQGFRTDLAWENFSFLDDLLDELLNQLVVAVQDPVVVALSGIVRSSVPPVLDDALNGISFGTEIPLPAPIDQTYGFDIAPSDASYAGPLGAGYIELSLDSQVYSVDEAARFSGRLGPITRPMVAPVFSPIYGAGVALSENTINQLLWAIWRSGAFEFDDIVALIPGVNLEGASLGLSVGLPPVFMPGRQGFDWILGLGEVRVTGTLVPAEAFDGVVGELNPVTVDLVLSVTNGVKVVRGTTDGIQLSFDSEPQVGVEVIALSDPRYKDELGLFLERLVRLVVPGLLENLLGTFPLPTLDLGDIVGDVAAGTELTISGVAKSGDYLRLTGGLE